MVHVRSIDLNEHHKTRRRVPAQNDNSPKMPGHKMCAMNVGPVTCAKNLIVALAPGTIDMPTTAAVIEHPKFGVVVRDAGINDAVAARRGPMTTGGRDCLQRSARTTSPASTQ